jgi:opacity protein-like surface antigen
MTKEVIRFEGIDIDPNDSDSTKIPDLYAGMHWQHFDAENTKHDTSSNGYVIGVHSGHSVGFNARGNHATFASDTPFSFKSGYFTAAFHDEPVMVSAFVGGVRVAHKIADILSTAQTFVSFGKHFAHIDSVTVSTGGSDSSQVAMDDLKVVFDGPIPSGAGVASAHMPGEVFAPHIAPDDALDRFLLDTMPREPGADHWMFA